MFVVSAKDFRLCFSGVLIALSVVLSLILLFSRAPAAEPDTALADAPDDVSVCLEFLRSHGWETEDSPPDASEVALPVRFGDVYASYNALQRAQGFDLLPYRGKTVKKYVFCIVGYPYAPQDDTVRATLLVYRGSVIGGDISSVRPDGFMHGFRFETVTDEQYQT